MIPSIDRSGRGLPRVVLLSMICGAFLGAAAAARGLELAEETPLLAHYELSFRVESWDKARLDQPLIGRYSSSDAQIMSLHARWARQAGIDGFLVRWRASDTLKHRLKKLAAAAAAQRIKLGIYYRPLETDQGRHPVEEVAADLEYLAASYDRDPVFDLFGRPLVIWATAARYSREEIRAVTRQLGERISILVSESKVASYDRVADLMDGNAVYWPSQDPFGESRPGERLAAMGRAVHARGGLWIAPAVPGYGRLSGTALVERRDGETLRRSLELALESRPDAIGLISWNRFGDNTHVEPGLATGMRSLAVIAEASGGVVPGTATKKRLPVTALAYYYIWYERRSWGRAKKDLPLLGAYSSDQRSIMRRHIQQAKLAGVNGFIVSWKSTAKLDRRLHKLRELAAESDFKLAVIYQGLDFERRPRPMERVIDDLEQFAATYADDPVFRIFDRPLVILNGTWEYSQEQLAAIGAAVRPAVLLLAAEKSVEGYRRVAELVDGNAYYWSSVDPFSSVNHSEKLTELGDAVHSLGGTWIAPAAPGYDARLIGGEQAVDRREGETLRRAVLTAMLSEPDAIGLISWNEFSENTHLEPSRLLGTRYLEILAELRGRRWEPDELDDVELRPTTVEVRTVPPVPGARFALDGRDFHSDEDGIARIATDRVGSQQLEVEPVVVTPQGLRAEFRRWESHDFAPQRRITNPASQQLEAGFEIVFPLSLRFADSSGRPVDPERFESLALRGPDGLLQIYEGTIPQELPGNRVIRRLSGLESQPTVFSIEHVEIDGSNVVARGRQRIVPAQGRDGQIELQLHQVRFRSRDALFGFGVGSGIRLRYPDGASRHFSLQRDHELVLDGLARGPYQVVVTGALGLSPPTAISLSRSQELVLPVVSYLDLAVLTLGGVTAALALLWWGRLRRWRVPRARMSAPDSLGQ